MNNAKALRPEDLNHLYEAKYDGSDELSLFIEKINLILCELETRKLLEEKKKLEINWEESFPETIPCELFDFKFEIETAFKDAGWYAKIASPRPRVAILVLKTTPFTRDELNSMDPCGL